MRGRSLAGLRALRSQHLHAQPHVAGDSRVRSRGARPHAGRTLPGRRRAIRLHRRRIEQLAEWPDGRVGARGRGDGRRRRPALRRRSEARLRRRHVGRRARRVRDGDLVARHRRRHRLERRLPRREDAPHAAVSGLRDGRHRRLQPPRDAHARSRADDAAPPGDLRRWPHVALERAGDAGGRVHDRPGDEDEDHRERRRRARSDLHEVAGGGGGDVRSEESVPGAAGHRPRLRRPAGRERARETRRRAGPRA